MQDWDTTVKLLIAESADRVLPMLGAARVERWLNVELPKTQNLRVDLLAKLVSGELLHIELQSTNLSRLPFRMLEYGVGIYRCERSFPVQILIYVGNGALRMKNHFREARLNFEFEIIDLKMLDGTELLESENVSDNFLALLMAVKDKAAAIRRVIGRINRLDELKRKDALARLLITCGLRKFADVAAAEITRMSEKSIVLPLLREDPFFKRLFANGRKKAELEGRKVGRKEGLTAGRQEGLTAGRQEGLTTGRQEGRDLGKRALLRLQLERKFGDLPVWASKRLSACSDKQIDKLAVRILDSPTLDELFGRK